MLAILARSRWAALVCVPVSLASAPAAAARPAAPPPELDAIMDRLIHTDSGYRNAALADLAQLGHSAAVAGLIDALYFDLVLDSRASQLLERLTDHRRPCQAYASIRQQNGSVSNISEAASINPRVMLALPELRSALRGPNCALGKLRQEMIAVLTSALHRCTY